MATHPQHDNPEDIPGEAKENGRIHIGSAELRERLSDLLSRVRFQDHRFIVERHGKPVAAVVSVEDLESLEALEDEADRETLRELDDNAETVPLEEMEEEALEDD
jgi:prevent-host-death family protein